MMGVDGCDAQSLVTQNDRIVPVRSGAVEGWLPSPRRLDPLARPERRYRVSACSTRRW
jgi:hypothetical protein